MSAPVQPENSSTLDKSLSAIQFDSSKPIVIPPGVDWSQEAEQLQ